MAKIQTYSLATSPLSLSDMLIGTEVGGPIPNATKNFSLGDLLDLFRSNTSPLNTKGDLYTFSTVNTRLGVGSNGQFLAADSSTPTGLKWVPAPSGTSPLISKGDIFTYDTVNARLPLGVNSQILSVDTSQPSGLRWINAPSGTSPLTTKGDIYSFSTTNTRLGVGVNGQILSADSTTATGLKWINAPSGTSPLTTKGDLYTFDTVNTRLGVGVNGQILSADSTTATGLRWINAPSGTSPLTTKGDIYVFSTTNTRLPIGSNGQILSANSASATGLSWINAPATSPLTTKGDLYTFDTANARLPIGVNGQFLTADSTAATGLKWVNAPSGTSPLTTKGDIYIYSTTNARLGVGVNGQILSADSTQTSGLRWINAPITSPLTTKGDIYTFDTINARLSVGANGQILSVDSTSATGLKWINAPATSPLTTKGDIYVFGTANTRLPIGTDSQILIADSTQPTGLRWTNSPTGTGYYAQYFSYLTQSATINNVGKAMIFETLDMSNGVTVVTDGTALTKITFANAGKYNLQFSTQFQNLDNAQHDIYIWLRKNGTTSAADVTGSTGLISIPARKAAGAGNEGHVIVGWNFLLDVAANDFYQIVWATSNITNVTIQFYASTSDHPSTASTLFTVTQPGGGAGSGGGGTPAAPFNSVQFNNSGSFGGDSSFSWDNTNKRLGIGTVNPIGKIHINYLSFDYINSGGANSHVFLSNPSPTGHTTVYSEISNSPVFKWTADSTGFNEWVAYGSHAWWSGPGHTSGNWKMRLSENGNLAIGPNAVDGGYRLKVNGTVSFPNLNNVSNPNVIGYNATTGELTFQPAGGGGSAILLPVPKVVLNQGKQYIQGLNKISGGALDYNLVINKYPTVIASDITQNLLNSYPVYLEMVHFRRKVTHKLKGRSGYVVEPDLRFDQDGNRTWNVNWPYNFFTRNQSPSWAPQGGVDIPVIIDRPNWYQVEQINQNIPVWQYLNSRFYEQSIEYRNESGSIDGLSTVIPVYGNRAYYKNAVQNGNRFAYSTWYNPLYVAFRYVVWDEFANAERGQIISGPLSRIVRVGHKDFPFRYDFNASSIHGVPCAGISDKYSIEQLQCFFETRLP